MPDWEAIFSLAAAQLEAIVHSIDYDQYSVECARMLKEGFAPQSDWVIEQGSVLDRAFLERLGRFDVIYCWGALHHTGDMWTALDNVARSVKSRGQLWISIYNDQGKASPKGSWSSALTTKAGLPRLWSFFRDLRSLLRGLVGDILRMRNPLWRYGQVPERGMDIFRDWIDWLGGWPFEVAKPEEVFDFCTQRGFTLHKLRTCAGGIGCNGFLFAKEALVKAEFTAPETDPHTSSEYQKLS
jgi:2-polyprenyl-6-hydroxyphenyl methylase/3-demethylubiquinone-9 3-methyltransferase